MIVIMSIMELSVTSALPLSVLRFALRFAFK